MSIRYYILPITQNGVYRGPKYFVSRASETGIVCPWAIKDYGLINECVICADILDEDHTSLSGNSDVMSLPLNIDNTMTQGAVNQAKTFLENYGIPAGWITASQTYRDVLRTVTAFFLYVQRVTNILGRAITLTGGALDTQIKNIPTDVRNALQQAAAEAGLDYSGVTGNTTVRQVLKLFADAWGTKPIDFGIAVL